MARDSLQEEDPTPICVVHNSPADDWGTTSSTAKGGRYEGRDDSLRLARDLDRYIQGQSEKSSSTDALEGTKEDSTKKLARHVGEQ